LSFQRKDEKAVVFFGQLWFFKGFRMGDPFEWF